MKVGLAVHNFPPEFLGGTEQVVLALARAHIAAGDEVFVLAGSEERVPGGDLRREDYDEVPVFRLRRDPEENYGLEGYRTTGERITDLFYEERPDGVHVHHWATLGWDVCQRAAALGIRAGVTLHDLWTACPRFFRRPPEGTRCPAEDERDSCVDCIGADMPEQSSEQVAEGIAKRDEQLHRELKCATFLAAPSEAQARLIEHHLPWRGRVEIVPHGLLSRIEEKATPRGPEDPLRVGTFGNLVAEKGVDLLVEALGECGDQVELIVSGAAPDPAYVEGLRALAHERGVPFRWTGPYDAGDRHPAMDLDLAVFPSLCDESYGLVVDEALARGVPVVVSSRGALPERARHGGVVVRSGGVMPLKVTLSSLLRSQRKLQSLRDAIPTTFPHINEAAARYRGFFGHAEVLQ